MSRTLSASHHVPAVPESGRCPDWKRQLTERLDAYRAKHPETASTQDSASHSTSDTRASRIARSVASRYADAPSYSDLLLAAAQAEHAAEEAQAALAQRVAEDARIAREKLEHDQREAQLAAEREEARKEQELAAARNQPGIPVMPQFGERTQELHLHVETPEPEPSLEDLLSSALVEPRLMLPSKLIEFPRELVSAQRPRLRVPEPPPPEPQFTVPELAQLRIFEVQPEEAATTTPAPSEETTDETPSEQTSTVEAKTGSAPVAGHPQRGRLPGTLPAASMSNMSATQEALSTLKADTAPVARENHPPARPYKGLEWAAISLDPEPALRRSRREETSAADLAPFITDPASIDRRLMAFAVDFAAVTAGFLAFLLVFAAATPHLPTGLTAVALGGTVYVLLWVLYQLLFFSMSGATAGMLYARIALCTFDDQNPTHSAMRRRLAAWWLSCLPLGLGFLWCFVDEDNLSWHDRITRIYQRSY